MSPFAPIIQQDNDPFSMFGSLQAKYDWVLPTWAYRDRDHLIKNVKRIVALCEQKVVKLNKRRQAFRPSPKNARYEKKRVHIGSG